MRQALAAIVEATGADELILTAQVYDHAARVWSYELVAAAWEATDLHLVATALVAAAARREETRGAHWREDCPDASDAWLGHLVSTLTGTSFEPLESA